MLCLIAANLFRPTGSTHGARLKRIGTRFGFLFAGLHLMISVILLITAWLLTFVMGPSPAVLGVLAGSFSCLIFCSAVLWPLPGPVGLTLCRHCPLPEPSRGPLAFAAGTMILRDRLELAMAQSPYSAGRIHEVLQGAAPDFSLIDPALEKGRVGRELVLRAYVLGPLFLATFLTAWLLWSLLPQARPPVPSVQGFALTAGDARSAHETEGDEEDGQRVSESRDDDQGLGSETGDDPSEAGRNDREVGDRVQDSDRDGPSNETQPEQRDQGSRDPGEGEGHEHSERADRAESQDGRESAGSSEDRSPGPEQASSRPTEDQEREPTDRQNDDKGQTTERDDRLAEEAGNPHDDGRQNAEPESEEQDASPDREKQGRRGDQGHPTENVPAEQQVGKPEAGQDHDRRDANGQQGKPGDDEGQPSDQASGQQGQRAAEQGRAADEQRERQASDQGNRETDNSEQNPGDPRRRNDQGSERAAQNNMSDDEGKRSERTGEEPERTADQNKQCASNEPVDSQSKAGGEGTTGQPSNRPSDRVQPPTTGEKPGPAPEGAPARGKPDELPRDRGRQEQGRGMPPIRTDGPPSEIIELDVMAPDMVASNGEGAVDGEGKQAASIEIGAGARKSSSVTDLPPRQVLPSWIRLILEKRESRGRRDRPRVGRCDCVLRSRGRSTQRTRQS